MTRPTTWPTTWKVAQKLSPLVKGPLTREHLKAYAASSLDHNPIHLEEDFAKEAGFPSVIAHGMLSMAFLGDLVRANFPVGQFRLKQLSSRFKKVTFPGDALTCEGDVKKLHENGDLELVLRVVNQKGEVTTDGHALVSPLKTK